MVIKTVRMGIPILVSRSGFTAWGVELARQGRADADRPRAGKRFIALAGEERIVFDQDLAYVEEESAQARRKGASTMTDDTATLGVMLAGGLARRMGGGDKPLRAIGGRTILDARDRAARRRSATGRSSTPTAIRRALPRSAAGGRRHGAGFRRPAGRRARRARLGRRASARTAGSSSAAGRLPVPAARSVARLHAARQARGAQLACARSGGQAHPVIGLWPRRAAPGSARRAGDRGCARSTAGPRATSSRPRLADEPLDPFFNANTPEDLAEAERLAGLDD